jgi:phenylpropionate dioxygenase-like ring-hydroxylating dioxygenase large terminal subunit
MFLSLINDLKNGEARPINQFQNKKFLLNSDSGYKIGSNVCPHHASKIIKEKTNNLMCQFHGWSWNTKGEPTGAGYTEICNNKRLHLTDAYEHQGLIFDIKTEIPELPVNFDTFELVEFRTDRLKVDNPMHIMNVFLDVDHIPLVHKDVYTKMGIISKPTIQWEYFEGGNVQKVYNSENPNELIFMWLSIYPYTMIEWQPGSVFITDCFNTTDGHTEVAVYKYKDVFQSSEEYDINQSTWETAWGQDKFQSEQMVAIYPELFEDQKLHYLNWATKNGISTK